MKTTNEEFEKALAEFTGAKGAIAVDSCTHAIELGLRFSKPKMYATIPEKTHYSVPMILNRLGIDFMCTDEGWDDMYRIEGSTVFDASQYFAKDMFQLDNPNQRRIICVSFGVGSALEIGHGGAILTNDKAAHDWFQSVVGDGQVKEYWEDQRKFKISYGYEMRTEDAVVGLNKLNNNEITVVKNGSENYPNIRDIVIEK